MKKTAIAMFVAFALIVSSASAFAEPPKDGMVMVADVLFARTTGLVAIAVGSVMWVVALPFSIPSGSVDTAGQLLVVDPCKFTFVRPLGDFDYKVGTAEITEVKEKY
ncbi:MAG TPA: hypothetical protein VFG28_05155 [Syntrophales bacterium]|nr:hypothetical protein [Syntrophales bacterium]